MRFAMLQIPPVTPYVVPFYLRLGTDHPTARSSIALQIVLRVSVSRSCRSHGRSNIAQLDRTIPRMKWQFSLQRLSMTVALYDRPIWGCLPPVFCFVCVSAAHTMDGPWFQRDYLSLAFHRRSRLGFFHRIQPKHVNKVSLSNQIFPQWRLFIQRLL